MTGTLVVQPDRGFNVCVQSFLSLVGDVEGDPETERSIIRGGNTKLTLS